MIDKVQSAEVSPASVASTAAPKRKKGWRGWLFSILVFLWGFWFLGSGWKHFTPKTEVISFGQWQDKTIAPRIAALRQKLAEIESRPINTVDEYIVITLETGTIVDEAKDLIRQEMGMIARFKQAYPDNAADARVADYMMRLTEKDEQFIYLLADEIECAKHLKALPVRRRVAYYTANVLPIKDKETQLMKDWLAIAKDAKAKGVPLPPYDQTPE